jgi:chromosome segregation ATPase
LEFWGILAPILISVILSVTGAFVVARTAGPAQAAYVSALEGRMKVLTQERDDAMGRIPVLEAEVRRLKVEVSELKESERKLLLRLDAAEAKADLAEARADDFEARTP